MPKVQDPILKCSCGQAIPIPGRRIADTIECPGCRKSQVILRSRVEGEVMPAQGTGAISDRLPEVQESLKRIRLRQAGMAHKGVALYPPAALLASGFFGFYLTAILAGQNLVALGFQERGRRLQVAGVLLYVLTGASMLAGWLRYGRAGLVGALALVVLGLFALTQAGRRVRALVVVGVGALLGVGARSYNAHGLELDPATELALVLGVPLIGALAFAEAGRREADAAFEAGAVPASPLVPAMIGFLLVVAQFFVVRIVESQLHW